MDDNSVSGFLEFDKLADAREHAQDEASSTGAGLFTCTLFRQGARPMLSVSFPFPFLANHVAIDPATKGGKAGNNVNRPLMADHVKGIRQYLLDNASDYVLPPVTLNLRKQPRLYLQRSNSSSRVGYLLVDHSTKFEVTDGQHRIAAIAGTQHLKPTLPPIFAENEDFLNDSIAALVVLEAKTVKVHQDFADAAQTKQIPASLLAAFNVRQPINKVVSHVAENAKLLTGRVDETSNTLSKYSQAIFTLNHIRVFAKYFLLGKGGQYERNVLDLSQREFATPERQEQAAKRMIRALDILTDNMKPWATIAAFKPGEAKSTAIPDLREQYVNLTGNGLAIIGRVGHEISKREEREWETLFVKLANLDWRRNGKIWLETKLVEYDPVKKTKRITGGRDILEATVGRVLKEVGLAEQGKEAGVMSN